MSSQAQLHPIGIEEYLDGELHSELRHEYVGGQMFAMVGASLRRTLICGNLHATLHRHLRGGPCRVVMADMKVRVEQIDAIYYPDIAVTCRTRDEAAYYLRHPKLIVEVLSSATESVDRREKLLNYRHLESLEEYVLVDQERPLAEAYRKSGEGWSMTRYEGAEPVRLDSVDLDLPLADLYEGVPEQGTP